MIKILFSILLSLTTIGFQTGSVVHKLAGKQTCTSMQKPAAFAHLDILK